MLQRDGIAPVRRQPGRDLGRNEQGVIARAVRLHWGHALDRLAVGGDHLVADRESAHDLDVGGIQSDLLVRLTECRTVHALPLVHPSTGEECTWQAALPPDMADLLQRAAISA